MRKLTCLVLLCLGMVTASAIPVVHVEFEQNEWWYSLQAWVTEGNAPAHIAFENLRYNSFSYGPGQADLTLSHEGVHYPILGAPLHIGLNEIGFTVGGIEYVGTFTFAQPTTPEPYPFGTEVPDAGSTLALMALGIGALLIRKRA